jgi:hypothetical protein
MEYIAGETWDTSWKGMSIKGKRGDHADERIYRRAKTTTTKCVLLVFLDFLAYMSCKAPDLGEYIGVVGFRPCWDLRISICLKAQVHSPTSTASIIISS